MSRWSSIASDEVAAAPAAGAGGDAGAAAAAATRWRQRAFDAPFDAPPEQPATTPAPATPDRRRTLHLETSPSRLDLAIEWMIVGLLAFMPFALGVVARWSEMVVVAAAAAVAVCLALRLALYPQGAGGGRRFAWSWAYVPVCLFVLLAAAQLVPLPASLVRAISPGTVDLRSELLPGATGRMTLNFYPYAAARELRLVAVAATLFVAVVNTFHRTAQIKRLLVSVAAIGGAVGLLALFQDLTASTRVFWAIPTPPGAGTARGGPFINPNNFAQFMNLSMGAALAALLVRVREELPRNLSPAQVFDRIQDPEFRSSWWLAGVVVAGAVTVFLSLSRGGMIAMLVAAAFTVLVLSWRRRMGGAGWLLIVAALFVFLALLYAGFDAVADRLATLHNANDPSSGRAQVYKDVAVVARKFPLVGMGLGAWEVTYPMFDRSTNAMAAEYADSDWAQLVHEMGAAGMVAVVLFVAVILGNFFRATRGGRVPVCTAAVGLGYGLVAVLVQAATDYGQHMPAVAGLTAVTCGLIVCLGQKAGAAEGGGRKVVQTTVVGLVVPAALVGALAWALVSVNSARVAEGHIDRAERVARRLEADGWQGSNVEYTRLLSDTSAASERQPRNAMYRYWLNLYRWRSISRTTDPQTGDLLMSDPQFRAAERIVGELHAARALCPTFGPAYSLAGQLEMLVLDRPDQGAADVRLGQRLSPTDPAATFAVGAVDAAEGKWDESLAKFRHCLELSPGLISDVIAVYAGAGRPDLALAVADGNVTYLQRLVIDLSRQPQHADTVRAAEDKLLSMLESEAQQSAAPASLLAWAAAQYNARGDRPAAIRYYQKTLAKDYDAVPWRLAMARCLAAEGRIQEAMREAQLCRRLKPQYAPARALVEELSVRRAPGPAPAPGLAPAPAPAK